MTRLSAIQPRFGQLEITVRGNQPQDILFDLSDKERSEGWEDSFVLMNMLPIGSHLKVGALSKAFREGNVPDEAMLRETVLDIIDHPETIDRSPEGFKMQHLLDTPWIPAGDGSEDKKTPFAFLTDNRALLRKAAGEHAFKALTKADLTINSFGQTAWLIPPDLKDADDISLQMVKLGCIGRKK